jgi:hypothetical protein
MAKREAVQPTLCQEVLVLGISGPAGCSYLGSSPLLSTQNKTGGPLNTRRPSDRSDHVDRNDTAVYGRQESWGAKQRFGYEYDDLFFTLLGLFRNMNHCN